MTDTPTYIVTHETGVQILEQSREFATAQQRFEQALRTFISDNEGITNGNRDALRDYLMAVASGETPDETPDYLTDLDISSLTTAARTAIAEGETLSAAIQSNNIADAAGAASILDKVMDRVSSRPNRENVDDFLNIRGNETKNFESVLEYAENPDSYPQQAAQYFIEEAYEYQRESTRYGNEFARFVQNNNLTEAQGRELDAYLGQLREGAALPEMSPLIARLADEHESKFRSLSERARDLNEARDEFGGAIDLLSKAEGFEHYAGKEEELFLTIDRLTRAYDHETRERILDTVIDRVTERSGEARRLRETGWPDGTDASYELGRSLLNIPQSAGDWFASLFDGFGGEGEGNGFNWQGLLGGAAGGIGGFFVGRMFGGGIIGTIASAALGIMGAYMGHSFASNNFRGDDGAESGRSSASTEMGSAGPRNLRIPDGQGGYRLVNAAEHQQYIYQIAGGEGARFQQYGVAHNPNASLTENAALPAGVAMRAGDLSVQF